MVKVDAFGHLASRDGKEDGTAAVVACLAQLRQHKVSGPGTRSS
jgi:hypothetical protein